MTALPMTNHYLDGKMEKVDDLGGEINRLVEDDFFIFMLLSRESDHSAVTSTLKSCRPPVLLSVFPNDTTSKLAGLFSTLSH